MPNDCCTALNNLLTTVYGQVLRRIRIELLSHPIYTLVSLGFPRFVLVSLGFPWFPQVSLRFASVSLGLPWLLYVSSGCPKKKYLVSLGSPLVSLGCPRLGSTDPSAQISSGWIRSIKWLAFRREDQIRSIGSDQFCR